MSGFVSIRTEGGLISPDILGRLVDRASGLPGTAPADYHLLQGESINGAIVRAWNRMRTAWEGFREATARLAEGDAATGMTRERLLLVLFQELGYGRLTAASAIEVDGRAYPVSHLWQQVPIHLVGCGVDLDRRTPGVAGAARMSPHGLVQELLNRSEKHLWGFVSNGLILRILRDNRSLTRQAYVEMDLEGMLEGELYSEFVPLWLLCHQSRVEAQRPEECWLEKWSALGQAEGTRALETLRDGVKDAIARLGAGFVGHPANRALRERLRSGALAGQELYRQVLRLVYRLIFLFVAEDRDALFDPAAPAENRDVYLQHYSAARLRRLAEQIRGSAHADLYAGLMVVMAALGGRGLSALALPALGSDLWSERSLADLNACELANEALLEALRALAFTQRGATLWRVDFRNLSSEELGSVYESLLELHPEINVDAGTFEPVVAAGHERKTTGSYYTPRGLVQSLLDTALEPVLDQAARASEPERALLALRIADPACGSGHFLVAAAHRVARRLAAVRTGDEEPSPGAMRTALRDVIGHCLYGVDLNPMAVELCKVSLWMEALEPGRPLSFLDSHILCGNSLLGATPELMEKGIPQEAFTVLTRDDKKEVAAQKKRNKEELAGARSLQDWTGRAWEEGEEVLKRFASLGDLSDTTLEGVEALASQYHALVQAGAYLLRRLAADAWCAAFVWPRRAGGPPALTQDVFARLMESPEGVPCELIAEVQRLAEQYRFFHWHLAFPEVFAAGGFDCVLGNPPWDTLSPDVKEFFSSYEPAIRFADRDGQAEIMDRMLSDRTIAARWDQYCRDIFAEVHFIKSSGRYRLFAEGNLGKGDFNVFRMFVETALAIARPQGFTAQLVPEGLYNGANSAAIRRALFSKSELECIIGFENKGEGWFPSADTRLKFCMYVAKRGGQTDSFRAAFRIASHERLLQVGGDQTLRIPVSIVKEFSPDAWAVMEFDDQRDIDITAKMYSRWPKFGDETAGPPMRTYMRELDMGNDRDLFGDDPEGIPLYEGRMVDQFDHRAKGYRSGRARAAVWEELPFGHAGKSIQPQWRVLQRNIPEKARERVGRYRIGFCDVTSPTNERSLIAALLPPGTISGHKVPTITFEDGWDWAYMLWLAVANSFAVDFVARKKVALTMSYTVLDTLPFPRLQPNDALCRRLVPLALRLTCCGVEMAQFWNAMAAEGWCEPVVDGAAPPGIEDEEARVNLRAEIDAIVARDVFGLTVEDMDYVLRTFPIWEEREEQKFGEYRTRELVLKMMNDTAPGALAQGLVRRS